jgi:hypothetical protein
VQLLHLDRRSEAKVVSFRIHLLTSCGISKLAFPHFRANHAAIVVNAGNCSPGFDAMAK